MAFTLTEARRRLEELVERAVAGEEILIGRRGRDEVAMISSATLRALRGELALLTQALEATRVTATEARRSLPRLLDEASGGKAFLITRRGRPVAMLRGIESGDDPVGIAAIYDGLAHDVGADLWAHAVDSLGDPGRAARWFMKPNRALGGRSPRAVAMEGGSDRVATVLGRIDHGVIS